jgi:hypothetical protein
MEPSDNRELKQVLVSDWVAQNSTNAFTIFCLLSKANLLPDIFDKLYTKVEPFREFMNKEHGDIEVRKTYAGKHFKLERIDNV